MLVALLQTTLRPGVEDGMKYCTNNCYTPLHFVPSSRPGVLGSLQFCTSTPLPLVPFRPGALHCMRPCSGSTVLDSNTERLR